MSDDHGFAIPAANLGDTDLEVVARINPEAAKEIARLADLMNRGQESDEEFLRLCQFLFDVGFVGASEHLLRRNTGYSGGRALYERLFGAAKQEEFDAGIAAFRSQFGLELKFVSQDDFLISTFRTDRSPPRSDEFALLSEHCEVRFGYTERDRMEADVTLHDSGREVFEAEECMLMYYVNGVWEIADEDDA